MCTCVHSDRRLSIYEKSLGINAVFALRRLRVFISFIFLVGWPTLPAIPRGLTDRACSYAQRVCHRIQAVKWIPHCKIVPWI